ncbi:MAG: sigma-70 family RNA polymerase sigma factor [Nonomuraea sp.]|nr:sigma-70 family RNA polymerase sigma factor [Nonomuraea sp.]
MPEDDERRSRFEAVYRETYEQILGYALRRCESPEDAADVVAETFATAWRRIDRLPGGDEARLWLYGTARKVLANHRRGQSRRPRLVALDLDLTQVRADHPQDDALVVRAVADAFAELSTADREILALSAWEGLDPGELAAVLRCSRNAARIRLHRARRRMSAALAGAGVTVSHYSVEST